MAKLFCFGLGYTAERLARRLAAEGYAIAGTTRDPQAKALALAQPAWALHRFEAESPLENPERALEGTTHLLLSIRPNEAGDAVLRWHADLIDAIDRTQLRWIGYLSTTGVYGDHQGAWVHENSPRKPTKARTRQRVEAEDAWLRRGAKVFRLAGIYGPGRSAIERVSSGKARRVLAPGKFFNRIHVDDIVTTLAASIDYERGIDARELPGSAFNVADGHPCSSEEVIAHAAQLLGVQPPPAVALADAQMSPMARSFWTDNVRISNARIVCQLGVELAHPDYRSGLAACLEAATPTAPRPPRSSPGQ